MPYVTHLNCLCQARFLFLPWNGYLISISSYLQLKSIEVFYDLCKLQLFNWRWRLCMFLFPCTKTERAVL